MCMSFVDLPLDRQESLYVSCAALADEDGYIGIIYTRKLPHYADELNRQYRTLDLADLNQRRTSIIETHTGHPHWAKVIELIDAELADRAVFSCAPTPSEPEQVFDALSPLGAPGYQALAVNTVAA